jgi:hypothetical protein
MMELSSEQFDKLTQQIYLRLGLYFEDKKTYFLQKRVEKRMAALGYQDPQEYVFHVCYADPEGCEMQGTRQSHHDQRDVHVSRIRPIGGVRELLPTGSAFRKNRVAGNRHCESGLRAVRQAKSHIRSPSSCKRCSRNASTGTAKSWPPISMKTCWHTPRGPVIGSVP